MHHGMYTYGMDTYGMVFKVHQESGHGARDVMHPRLMDIYANITQVQCTALIASCEHCQKKKLRQQKGIVVKVW